MTPVPCEDAAAHKRSTLPGKDITNEPYAAARTGLTTRLLKQALLLARDFAAGMMIILVLLIFLGGLELKFTTPNVVSKSVSVVEGAGRAVAEAQRAGCTLFRRAGGGEK